MSNQESVSDHPYKGTYFNSRLSPTAGRDSAWKSICGYLQRTIPDDGAVLDLGAGYCSFINNVRAQEKFALDIFPEFSTFANPDVKTHVGTCTDLGVFSARQLNVVFASNLLEHLTREATHDVLKEVRRVLKPGGYLIILQPNFRYAFREYFDDFTHLQIFNDVGLADLLTAHGFLIEKVEPRFLPFSFKSRLPAWGWLVAMYLHLPIRPMAKQMLLVARKSIQEKD